MHPCITERGSRPRVKRWWHCRSVQCALLFLSSTCSSINTMNRLLLGAVLLENLSVTVQGNLLYIFTYTCGLLSDQSDQISLYHCSCFGKKHLADFHVKLCILVNHLPYPNIMCYIYIYIYFV